MDAARASELTSGRCERLRIARLGARRAQLAARARASGLGARVADLVAQVGRGRPVHVEPSAAARAETQSVWNGGTVASWLHLARLMLTRRLGRGASTTMQHGSTMW